VGSVDCVRQLAKLVPATLFIMLTVYDDPDSIFDSLAAGASGYLLKPVRVAELLAAIKDVTTGGAPMTSNIARKVVQSFKRAGPSRVEAENLSDRELAVLHHLVKGLSYKEVAAAMEISYSTVHTHIERIYQKLHVRSKTEAVARYLGV
jgi:DNA-binding NarL/FixJ family response regulator